MSRPATLRRTKLSLESLESRKLLTGGGPSADAQYMLELINEARTNPAEMANRVTSSTSPDVVATVNYYGVDLNSVKNQISSSASRPPIAWNGQLAAAATYHSEDMANTGVQTHVGSDGSTLDQRLNGVGYNGRAASGENAYAYANSVDHAMEAFLIDWGVGDHGHRNNLLQPDSSPNHYYKEVGIGIVASNKPGFGPEVITQDFGTQTGQNPFIVGVVYNDPNHNGRYDLGEGQGNVEVDAVNVDTGETHSTSSWDAGGYQIQVPTGTYDVTAKVNGQAVRTERVFVGDQNVKVDYDLSNPWQQQSPPAPTPPAPATVVAAPASQPPAATFTFSDASTVSQANIAQQQLQPPSQSLTVTGKTASERTGWFSTWSAWTARRVG
jgi:uncharacterized protein YkwD